MVDDSAAFKVGWLGTNLGPLSIGQSSSVLVDANSDATLCFTMSWRRSTRQSSPLEVVYVLC